MNSRATVRRPGIYGHPVAHRWEVLWASCLMAQPADNACEQLGRCRLDRIDVGVLARDPSGLKASGCERRESAGLARGPAKTDETDGVRWH